MASFKHIRALGGLLAAAARLLADVVFPPRCPSCHADVAADGNFCSDCFNRLRLIAPPFCACCGVPFVVAIEGETQCPDCLAHPPEFTRARAVMVYDKTSAPLISALKFHDQWAGLERYTAMMCAAGSALLKEADLLIPVPLHWRRLLHRKFNQSALLAHGVAQASGHSFAPELLRRVRYTTPQMRLDRKTRTGNVKKAFAVPEALAPRLRGKTIVLVDDVVTTGATANACARALKKAGAAEVRVLALARTVRE